MGRRLPGGIASLNRHRLPSRHCLLDMAVSRFPSPLSIALGIHPSAKLHAAVLALTWTGDLQRASHVLPFAFFLTLSPSSLPPPLSQSRSMPRAGETQSRKIHPEASRAQNQPKDIDVAAPHRLHKPGEVRPLALLLETFARLARMPCWLQTGWRIWGL